MLACHRLHVAHEAVSFRAAIACGARGDDVFRGLQMREQHRHLALAGVLPSGGQAAERLTDVGEQWKVEGSALTSFAMKRGDDSRRDRAAKAKGIAYGDHPIADARRGAVPEFDERQATGIDLQNREIGCDITTDQLRLIFLTIGQEIGRASCRERGCQSWEISVVACPIKKKNK